ncbi:GNAT family N-acetyltransferase [uncultured Roseobacter sp.]|uniref:GNAT family N-acetyltransferase n=1 Tax=uncultured Roseobacter sp. TaxID=114847 RepID=UPI00260BCFFD|nr:GNAT family N-acetyltransferase [uncultured Roseobacter sp.]
MRSADHYTFRSATAADLDQLLDWQSRPHVRESWDATAPSDAKDFDDSRVARWVVGAGGQPFAYVQDYTVHGWENHHFFDLPKGSRGIDHFICELSMTGKGHGPAFISQRLNALFDEGVPVIATDPHPDNARAIAAYKKADFKDLRPAEKTPWGLILPMAVYP